MLATVLVATALTRITIVDTRATHDVDINLNLSRDIMSEDELTPEFTEQLRGRENEGEVKHYTPQKRSSVKGIVIRLPNPNATQPRSEGRRRSAYHDEVDVVDREDHVTQYLADLLVNTDSEITSLQASESDEDDRVESTEVEEDTFFTFVTGQEKILEVEGVWVRPTAKGTDFLVLLPHIFDDEVRLKVNNNYILDDADVE